MSLKYLILEGEYFKLNSLDFFSFKYIDTIQRLTYPYRNVIMAQIGPRIGKTSPARPRLDPSLLPIPSHFLFS